jgi:hypothetical protein
MLIFKSKMRWSKNEAIGFLHRFWWTVLEYAPDGVVSALPSVVMSESLGMSLDQFEQAVSALEESEFLRRNGDMLLVHDWLEYAGRYLQENKFRRNPARLAQIHEAHGVANGMSGTSPGQANAPHQPNQPTNHTPRVDEKALGHARGFAQNWISANLPSFLNKKTVEAFARLSIRLGKDESGKQVLAAYGKPDVGNPILWLEGKLDKQSAAKAVKDEPPKRVQRAKEYNV